MSPKSTQTAQRHLPGDGQHRRIRNGRVATIKVTMWANNHCWRHWHWRCTWKGLCREPNLRRHMWEFLHAMHVHRRPCCCATYPLCGPFGHLSEAASNSARITDSQSARATDHNAACSQHSHSSRRCTQCTTEARLGRAVQLQRRRENGEKSDKRPLHGCPPMPIKLSLARLVHKALYHDAVLALAPQHR